MQNYCNTPENPPRSSLRRTAFPGSRVSEVLYFPEAVSEGFLNPREASPEGCPWIRGVDSVELSDGLLQLVAVENVAEAAGSTGRSVIGGRAYRRRLGRRRRRHTAGGLAAVEGVLCRVLGLLQAAKSRHRLGKEKKKNYRRLLQFNGRTPEGGTIQYRGMRSIRCREERVVVKLGAPSYSVG